MVAADRLVDEGRLSGARALASELGIHNHPRHGFRAYAQEEALRNDNLKLN
jgi:hypothetical protein